MERALSSANVSALDTKTVKQAFFPEILLRIASLCARHELAILSRTSKSLNEIATPMLYRHVLLQFKDEQLVPYYGPAIHSGHGYFPNPDWKDAFSAKPGSPNPIIPTGLCHTRRVDLLSHGADCSILGNDGDYREALATALASISTIRVRGGSGVDEWRVSKYWNFCQAAEPCQLLQLLKPRFIVISACTDSRLDMDVRAVPVLHRLTNDAIPSIEELIVTYTDLHNLHQCSRHLPRRMSITIILPYKLSLASAYNSKTFDNLVLVLYELYRRTESTNLRLLWGDRSNMEDTRVAIAKFKSKGSDIEQTAKEARRVFAEMLKVEAIESAERESWMEVFSKGELNCGLVIRSAKEEER